MIFKSDGQEGDLNGFLDAGCRVQGELHFEDTFRVDGKVTGKVISAGALVIGQRGEVEGTVEVGSLFVSGTLRGTVKVSRKIEVSPGGRLLADIETPALEIEDGGFFQGSCTMVGEPESPAIRPLPFTTEGR